MGDTSGSPIGAETHGEDAGGVRGWLCYGSHTPATVLLGGATALQVLEDLRGFPVAVRQVFGEYPRSIDGGE